MASFFESLFRRAMGSLIKNETLAALENIASAMREGEDGDEIPSKGEEEDEESEEKKKKKDKLKSMPAAVTVVTSLPFVLPAPEEDTQVRVTVLIIAMAKKVYGKPMLSILERLSAFPELRVLVLDDAVMMSEPIEAWPRCDCLVAFNSTGYPLEKVGQYAKLRNPFILNDIDMQGQILDRREVYRLLEESGIPVPFHVFASRDREEVVLEEKEDSIIVNGVTITKPFVMKPVSAEDHDIYIYFASHDGGGAQHLFRKQKDRASEFLPDCNTVPKEGSYIFEQFMHTGGTDIKVYTVGSNYAHAEARKAPGVDGKVLRDKDGKEIRCPILLTAFEKDLARRVVSSFKQNICGFDLLRTQDNKSYVCDVNGFSFVKRSKHYFDDCARLVRFMVLQQCNPALYRQVVRGEAVKGPTRIVSISGSLLNTGKKNENDELLCVIAVIRHGDRTPKQKMKMKVKYPEFLAFFDEVGTNHKDNEVKLKTRHQLRDVLARTRAILLSGRETDEGNINKLKQIETILTRWPISGINRKLQLKPNAVDEATGKVTEAVLVLKWGGELTDYGLEMSQRAGEIFREQMYPSHSVEGIDGLLRLHSTYRHDLKLYSSDEGRVQMTAASFAKGLLKLDGEITPILVSLVRKDKEVNGLLDETKRARVELEAVKKSLHASFLSDKSWSELAPDLFPESLGLEKTLPLYGPRECMRRMFELVSEMVEALRKGIKDGSLTNLYNDESPLLMFSRWEKLKDDLYSPKTDTFDVSKISDFLDSVKYNILHNNHLNLPQVPELYALSKALADIIVPNEYGITKDEKVIIGKEIGESLLSKIIHDMYMAAGKEGKLAKFQNELVHRGVGNDVNSTERHVRTRLYFTSESHIHALFNLLKYANFPQPVSRSQTMSFSGDSTGEGPSPSFDFPSQVPTGEFDGVPSASSGDALGSPLRKGDDRDLKDQWRRAVEFLSQVSELNYLTHIVFRLFRRSSDKGQDTFVVEVIFSPGQGLKAPDAENLPPLEPLVLLHPGMLLEQLEQVLRGQGQMQQDMMDEGPRSPFIFSSN